MKANLEAQTRTVAYYTTMVDRCADAIKQLSGFTPENFKFTFSINDTNVVSFPINEEEGNFCMSFFMSWHAYYSRKLKLSREVLDGLNAAKVAV